MPTYFLNLCNALKLQLSAISRLVTAVECGNSGARVGKMCNPLPQPRWKTRARCVCVCFNSRNDVPRVAQRYGTIAAHTRRRASVLVVFVVFCVHMYSFAGLIRRTPPPTFSDTAITDRHSDTTFSSSELTGCGYPGLLDRKNRSDMCPRWESNPRLPACKASTLSTRPGSPLPPRSLE